MSTITVSVNGQSGANVVATSGDTINVSVGASATLPSITVSPAGTPGGTGPQGPAGGVSVSSATPQPLGTASAGTSADASRADHVHAMPEIKYSAVTGTPTLAAIATSGSASDLASGTVPASLLPTATGSQLGAIKVGSGLSIAGGVLSATGGGGGSGVTLSSSTPQPLGTASAGSSSEASRADHVHAMPAASSISGLAKIATSGSASDLSTGTVPAATLPAATSSTLGAVKVGSGLAISSGVLSATGSGASFVTAPASKTATGTVGQFAADSSWLYACYATDSWLRVARDAWITVPAAPTITSASGTFQGSVVSGNLTGGTVDVAWTAPTNTGGEITGYVVQLDANSPVSVGAQVTNYQFTGLTTNASTCRSFTVSVRAVNSAGQSSAATASGVMPESTVPSLWSISKVPNEGAPGVQYSIAWMPPCSTGGWTSYEIQLREYYNGSEVVVTGDEDGWGTWATVSGTTGHSAQVSATSNQQFQFRVRALTASTNSGWSNVQTL